MKHRLIRSAVALCAAAAPVVAAGSPAGADTVTNTISGCTATAGDPTTGGIVNGSQTYVGVGTGHCTDNRHRYLATTWTVCQYAPQPAAACFVWFNRETSTTPSTIVNTLFKSELDRVMGPCTGNRDFSLTTQLGNSTPVVYAFGHTVTFSCK